MLITSAIESGMFSLDFDSEDGGVYFFYYSSNSVEIDLSTQQMKRDGTSFPIREVNCKCMILKRL